MKRKKFTTTLTQEAFLGLDIIKGLHDMPNKNEVIEYLVSKYLEENNLEEIVNGILKKDRE